MAAYVKKTSVVALTVILLMFAGAPIAAMIQILTLGMGSARMVAQVSDTYALNVMAATIASPLDGHSYYFGNDIAVPQDNLTTSVYRIYPLAAGTINIVYIKGYAPVTAGTAEAWSCYVRVNSTTDTLIQTTSSAGNIRTWTNLSLGLAVTASDYFEIKCISPTWATDPVNLIFSGYVRITN